MKEQMRIIRIYLNALDAIFYKKDMGYPISQDEYDRLSILKEEALKAKEEIKRESKEIKKILRKVK